MKIKKELDKNCLKNIEINKFHENLLISGS